MRGGAEGYHGDVKYSRKKTWNNSMLRQHLVEVAYIRQTETWSPELSLPLLPHKIRWKYNNRYALFMFMNYSPIHFWK